MIGSIKKKLCGILTFCHAVCKKGKHPAKRDLVVHFAPGFSEM